MGLADQILALHKDIHEVSIIEERDASYVVIDEASRAGVKLLADRINEVSDQSLLGPIIILGAATQFGAQQSTLIGIEYENAGLVIASLADNKLLLLSTKLECLNDVMTTISTALPQLKKLARQTQLTLRTVTSAAQAENSARSFLKEKFPHGYARVLIHEISYRERDCRWDVQGSQRPRFWSELRKFRVEIDANDGLVKGFFYSNPSPSSLVLFLELICIGLLAALLAFLAFYTRIGR